MFVRSKGGQTEWASLQVYIMNVLHFIDFASDIQSTHEPKSQRFQDGFTESNGADIILHMDGRRLEFQEMRSRKTQFRKQWWDTNKVTGTVLIAIAKHVCSLKLALRKKKGVSVLRLFSMWKNAGGKPQLWNAFPPPKQSPKIQSKQPRPAGRSVLLETRPPWFLAVPFRNAVGCSLIKTKLKTCFAKFPPPIQ